MDDPRYTDSRPVLGIGLILVAACLPLGRYIAMGWKTTAILEHAGQMQTIPGQEDRIPVGEIVFRAA